MEYEYCCPNGTQNKKYGNSQTVKKYLKIFNFRRAPPDTLYTYDGIKN
jgi:hypothetical protein